MIISNHNKHPITKEAEEQYPRRKKEVSSVEILQASAWGDVLDSACQPNNGVITGGKGRNELIDINGCGFDGGARRGGEKPMEKMKRQRK